MSPQQEKDHEFYKRATESVGGWIHEATFAFFGLQNGVFHVLGSGVLFEMADLRFAFSAAHVFDEISACWCHGVPVCINPGSGSTKFIPIRQGNTFVSSKMPASGDRLDDPVDMGIVEWTKETGDEIAKTRPFLHQFQLDLHDAERPGNSYLVYGYPAAAVEHLNDQKTVTYDCLKLITRIYQGGRGAVQRSDPRYEMVLDFVPSTTRAIDGGAPQLYKPHGISGCGIWRLVSEGTHRDRWSPSMVKLVGIEHTWNKDVEVFRGTRIGYLLISLVLQRHPELRNQLGLFVAE